MGVICTVQHAKMLGYCAKGMRRYLKDKGIDYLKFVREGMDSDVFSALNDAMADKLVEVAKNEEIKHGRRR